MKSWNGWQWLKYIDIFHWKLPTSWPTPRIKQSKFHWLRIRMKVWLLPYGHNFGTSSICGESTLVGKTFHSPRSTSTKHAETFCRQEKPKRELRKSFPKVLFSVQELPSMSWMSTQSFRVERLDATCSFLVFSSHIYSRAVGGSFFGGKLVDQKIALPPDRNWEFERVSRVKWDSKRVLPSYCWPCAILKPFSLMTHTNTLPIFGHIEVFFFLITLGKSLVASTPAAAEQSMPLPPLEPFHIWEQQRWASQQRGERRG